MEKRIFGLALVASLFASRVPPALCDPILDTAQGLLNACQELERTLRPAGPGTVYFDGQNAITCWGFMGAMLQISVLADPATKQRMVSVCPPSEVNLVQLIQVFTTFAQAHPELLHEPPASVVLRAFQAAYPCP